MGTSTSAFGVGKRESHDATDFYARFAPPQISDDDTLGERDEVDVIHVGDARDMSHVPDASVALVVTSPPYFAGKEYETALGEGHVPADYIEYLEMLRDVLRESVRTLEPGGRIAVNVAQPRPQAVPQPRSRRHLDPAGRPAPAAARRRRVAEAARRQRVVRLGFLPVAGEPGAA